MRQQQYEDALIAIADRVERAYAYYEELTKGRSPRGQLAQIVAVRAGGAAVKALDDVAKIAAEALSRGQ